MPRKKKVPEEIVEEATIEKSIDTPEKEAIEENTSEALNSVDSDVSTHELQADMTLDEIQEFVDEVSAILSKEDILHINLEKLQVVTTPIVQAVICLNRYAADNEKKIKWLNPSSEFSDGFNNLGFYSEMMKLEFA